METSGKGMIIASSIAYLFMSLIFFVIAYMAVGMSEMLTPLIGNAFGILGVLLNGNLLVISLIIAVVSLALGLFGFNWGGKPHKALFFVITGAVLTAYNIFILITAFSAWSIATLMMSFTFAVGGFLNTF